MGLSLLPMPGPSASTSGPPMESGALRHHERLARLAAAGMDAHSLAQAAGATWRAVDLALAPVIGRLGVRALFRRSLVLGSIDHPWLAVVNDSPLPAGDFSDLQSALAGQTGSAAAAAQGALLQTYAGLLTEFIGAPLTERLLQPVWDLPSCGPAALDASP